MRKTTELFLVDGKPMLAPDENVEISLEDMLKEADEQMYHFKHLHKEKSRTT